MRGLTRKLIITSLLSLFFVVSGASNAGVNPFKKTMDYTFGDNIPWYANKVSVTKSGFIKDGSDTDFYHLNIDKHRLLLRLGRNDPSGELVNTRLLDTLEINEVMADGQRLPIFDWCIKNQHVISNTLKQNAVVVNDTCINAGGGGDFVINLDDQTKGILKSAKTLSFIIEPFGRPVKLAYSMKGFSGLMTKLDAPVPVAKKVVPVVVPVVVKAEPPKPKPKPKPVKMCYAKAPSGFESAIPAITYPCDNAEQKEAAETKVAARVAGEKKKMAAELEASKREQLARQKSVENNKREVEWEQQQAEMWIKRCKRHWAKGKSPCYCDSYIDKAPAGVTSTCGK